MALDFIPPWLQITPSYFTSALEAGARAGLAVSEQQQRVAQLAEARAERQAALQQRADEQAERQREFEQSRLLDVQRLAQNAQQFQQQVAHQTAQEANQAAQESRLLEYDKGRLAVENRRAALAEKNATLQPLWVPQVGDVPGHFVTRSGGVSVPQTRVADLPPTERTGKPVHDADGNVIGTDVGGGRIIPIKQDADARATFRSLEQQLHEVERNLANPKNTLLSTSPGVKAKLDDWTRQRDDLRQRLSRLNPEAYPPLPEAAVVGATGRINPLPASKGELVTGTLYDTKRGVARWNGTAFEPVAVK